MPLEAGIGLLTAVCNVWTALFKVSYLQWPPLARESSLGLLALARKDRKS